MFQKSLTPALLATAVSTPFIYLVQSQPAATAFAGSVVIVFLATLGSALLARRTDRSGAKRRQRSQPSAATATGPREQGQVKWFNASKGFGFITRDSGDDVFVHFRSIRGEGHRVLKDGQRVEYSVSQGDKGLQADDVVAL